MATTNTNPLTPEIQKTLSEQLRDVHLPEAVSWWPLAWGWWVLIALALCLLITTSYLLFKHKKKNRYRTLANTSLIQSYQNWQSTQDKQAYLHAANDILKRCVLVNDNTSQAATLSGKNWITQLNHWAKIPLSKNAEQALAVECYQAEPQSDINALHKELLTWLESHQIELGGQHA